MMADKPSVRLSYTHATWGGSLLQHLPEDPRLALKLLRHVSLFGWLLKNFLHVPILKSATGPMLTLSTPSPADAAYVMRRQKKKKPVAIVSDKVFYHMAERRTIEYG
jgi:hypothetical protein